ncbi:FadR/GntR family transcriptional regulator [Clostridium beijerinckii]|uniref:FadR family transcriptional regulator n=1 Tax=Clostridium beijerinckii TaxID=1520 RepID=A0A1S8RU97_CLOBE|nr:FadR/GntR family transcriptional regulator [Clostridium beijerinckii]MBA8935953.1 GntR family transcriptional repressor for pyruvate dehydrogenase complex [Clostridium beijerinckii]NMF07446.1 FadR family transcriptional regulator [Clostridium beijerinckii]NOW07181.1 GntR family transcriptional repressor for pyruvate dehydrogenase complex [Clostridium beijerinckii]NRT32584.1 GntR family transcriptional repressor for pyruvate dehydrogenase complex [Clostridium beijerinckii]NRT47988.1 GntR fam
MFTSNSKTPKVYHQVIEQIKNNIKSGKLKKGDRLPSEREMSESLGVSRASIREALRALEVVGLVESRQGAGNYIKTNFDNSLFEPLSVMFMLQESSIEEMYDLRETLELRCARLSAKNIENNELELLTAILDRMYIAENEAESLELDIKFHYLIAKTSRNTLLINVLEVISQLMDEFIRKSRAQILHTGKTRENLLEIHENLVRALKCRDASKAHNAMVEHFDLIRGSYGYKK